MKIRRYTQVGYGSAISGDQLTTANLALSLMR
jgi:hypothetical protein